MSQLSSDLCLNGCSAQGVCVSIGEAAECICNVGFSGSDCSAIVTSPATAVVPVVVSSCHCWVPWLLVFLLLAVVGGLFGCWYKEWAARRGVVVDKDVGRRRHRHRAFVPRDEVVPSAPPV